MEGREARMHRRASEPELAERYYELSAKRVGVEPLPRV